MGDCFSCSMIEGMKYHVELNREHIENVRLNRDENLENINTYHSLVESTVQRDKS